MISTVKFHPLVLTLSAFRPHNNTVWFKGQNKFKLMPEVDMEEECAKKKPLLSIKEFSEMCGVEQCTLRYCRGYCDDKEAH